METASRNTELTRRYSADNVRVFSSAESTVPAGRASGPAHRPFARLRTPLPARGSAPVRVMLSMKRGRDVKGSDVVDPGPEVGGGQCSSFYRLLEGGPCCWEHSSWSIFLLGPSIAEPHPRRSGPGPRGLGALHLGVSSCHRRIASGPRRPHRGGRQRRLERRGRGRVFPSPRRADGSACLPGLRRDESVGAAMDT
jgi:hypothetical protein